MMNLNYYDVVKRPIVTEKANSMIDSCNKYVFLVHPSSTKHVVKAALEKIFNVKINAVNIINNKGKNKRFKGVKGRRSDTKKAIVTLADGNEIDFAFGSK